MRSRLVALAAAHFLLMGDASIPPAIDPGSVVNAASRMPSSLPGGALARGARFSLTGVRLGPEREVQGSESDPPVLLDGVSVQIGNVSARILFASASRIEGLIPRSAPLGHLRLTVTYNGVTSEPYAITLVDSSFGFFTPDTLPKELSGADLPLSFSPGEIVALLGTGLDDAQPEIFVAGKPITIRRASEEDCCQGVNRIEFPIPADAPLGCDVPIQARADGRPSNVIGISIHRPGEPCSDQFEWFEKTVENARRAGFVALARISLDPETAAKVGTRAFDYAVAAFGNQQAGQRPFPPLPPFGACTGTSGRTNLRQVLTQARSPSSWTAIPAPAPGNRPLDAGPGISISGPAGVKLLRREGRQRNAYSALLGGAVPFSQVPPIPLYFMPGLAYHLTSPGGKDIGSFDARIEAQRAIDWKNRGRLARVQRAAGVTLEWKEARRDDAVLIVAAGSDRITGDSSVCVCLAYARDRRFTIPAISLANLPPTGNDDLEPSLLLISELPLSPPVSINAKGLDAAFATFLSVNARMVQFR